ncbi:P-loop containing nucleoside triphosphate hydrolase protein [Nemania serpens]|nr:P-loop containing nucleoside triphosphate hydrolase protein [Nemania serpens]
MTRREWKGFAQRQLLHRRVDRIILDEAQEVLGASHIWRQTLLDMRRHMDLVSYRQIYLTGTLPPSEQPEFLKRLRLEASTTIVRAPTVRDNLLYEYIDDDVEFSCPSLIEDFVLKVARQGQRAIVFTISKVDCNLLAEKLSLPKHHGDMNYREQQESLSRWKRSGGAIVATTTLAVGVDFDVSLVVCIGAFNMLTMCQQFGRAGRDGRPAACYLVAKRCTLKNELRQFATASCKRDAISRYLDGVPGTCGFHHNACTSCRISSAEPSDAAAAAAARPARAAISPAKRSKSLYIPIPSVSPAKSPAKTPAKTSTTMPQTPGPITQHQASLRSYSLE